MSTSTAPTVTPERRAFLASIGRLGGKAFAAQNDTAASSQRARGAFRESFLHGHKCSVCPPVNVPAELPMEERERRAKTLYGLHFSRLAFYRHRTPKS